MLKAGGRAGKMWIIACAALVFAHIASGQAMLWAQPAPTATSPVSPTRALFDPVALYLMWQHDPTTTMTVCWQTQNGTAGAARPARLECQKLDETMWRTVSATSRAMPFSERTTHMAEITGLQPAATYRFRFGPDSKTYTFRTMPASADRPIRFAAGGDTMHQKAWFEKTNRLVLKYDPDFVMLGGDLAYDDGKPGEVKRIYDWLDACKSTLVTPQNRVVPIVVTLGNHEVQGGFDKTAEQAPYFHHLFPFPGLRGYNVLDFGRYMSLIVLDSGHTNPIPGRQTEWLSRALEARRDVPYKFPVYHVPAYPSVRQFDERVSPQVRQHWVPLFERFGVRVAFENHDHAYKRTHPIRSGQVDHAQGVIYLGDGAWGVEVRKTHPESWYLAKTASVRHFILVTLQGQHQQFQAIDEEGNVIDQYPSAPQTGPGQ